MSHVMIDLETLNTTPDAAILSIGAVRFSKDDVRETFYRAVSLDSNLKAGRSVSGSTVAWWMGQSEEARKVFSDPNVVSLESALVDLADWFQESPEDKVWGNGAVFDIAILNDAYSPEEPPWKFWNIRCYRTIKEMKDAKSVEKPENPLAHNALYDAVVQAQHLQNIWRSGFAL